ncbi:FadR/GntR family transcriptional regulator [Sphingomonas sp. Leaf62]|uniref:FadR/GntR family transcriptional regulator n=1 Tax=Sphingomonas sp. Leaf62 TaxID=1736228 RepID=UPI0006FC4EEA|nr:FadR/GntR family transcriptional regulator [Sphingomonas sp. Leaf62]KQN74348.1 GntR family transcriptional regulator [Sphingomonas sp. Leaf62]
MTDILPAESLRIRRRPRLAEAVVEDLVKAIVTETYPAGTALPPEGMLGEMYGVSRTVIREATMALTEKGLVVSQQGRGTIVRDSGAWGMLDPMILGALFQREDGLAYLDNLSEIRSLLEGAMAAKAAARRTPEAVEELTGQMAKLERLIPHPAAYVHEDVAFHDIVMRISGDKLSKAVIDGVQAEALRNHGYSGKLNVEHVRETHAAHEAIYEAIVRGDPEGASRAMRDHIETSWARRRAARKPRR